MGRASLPRSRPEGGILSSRRHGVEPSLVRPISLRDGYD